MVWVGAGPPSISGETLTFHGLTSGAARLVLLLQPGFCVPSVVVHLHVRGAAQQWCYAVVVVDKSGMVTPAMAGSCCCLWLLSITQQLGVSVLHLLALYHCHCVQHSACAALGELLN